MGVSTGKDSNTRQPDGTGEPEDEDRIDFDRYPEGLFPGRAHGTGRAARSKPECRSSAGGLQGRKPAHRSRPPHSGW